MVRAPLTRSFHRLCTSQMATIQEGQGQPDEGTALGFEKPSLSVTETCMAVAPCTAVLYSYVLGLYLVCVGM